jgi:hypothetical protein
MFIFDQLYQNGLTFHSWLYPDIVLFQIYFHFSIISNLLGIYSKHVQFLFLKGFGFHIFLHVKI